MPKVPLSFQMSNSLFPATRFRVRRFVLAQPWFCLALAVTGVLCVLAFLALASMRHAITEATREQFELVATNRAKALQPKVAILELPLRPFDSAQAVAGLTQVADESNIVLGEVSFTLEEGVNQPFLRYRATMTVSANYLAVRRFVENVHSQLTDVSLETISCSREAITATLLKCDIVFTAYYREAEHG
jgi:hypothetical protein